MIDTKNQATRKGLKGDRVAVCPKFGCSTLEKLKPLKLGLFGIQKYPKCKDHKIHLVFVDEFIGDFLQSVNACLFDNSIAPPKDLLELVIEESPKNLLSVYHKWMYCSSLGRGAKIVPGYLDSLSRAYKNSLNKRQKKSIENDSYIKKRNKLITLGFRKIEMEYIEFLKKLYDMNERLFNKEEIKLFPRLVKKLIQDWLIKFLKNINKGYFQNKQINNADSISLKKTKYDKILQARTCMLILGRSPSELPIKISPYELFAAYRIFLENNLYHEFVPEKNNLKIGSRKEYFLQELNNNNSKVENIKEINRNTSFILKNWGEYYGVIYILIDNNKDNTLKYKMLYIGQTIQKLKIRFYSHINYSPNKYLREAFGKYGKTFSILKIDNKTLQTTGGEFTMKVIKKCKDLDKLNKYEKFFIKKYKSCVLDHYFIGKDGKRRPLYGYNISRGGGGYPAITGEEHGSFIHIDQDSLKDLLKRGFSAEEIAREFEISIPTLISKVEYYWKHLGIENLRDSRAKFGGNKAFLDRFGIAAKSVVGVELDIPKLIDLIEQGLFLSELEEELGTSFSTITKHLQKIGFKNLTDARIRLGAMETFRRRWIQKKASATLRGSDHQDYIQIIKEDIIKIIKLDRSPKEIADYFGVSRPTILSRLNEYWGVNFYEAKRLFKIYPKVDKILGENIISSISECAISDIDIIYLQSLIYAGFNMTQIALIYERGVKWMHEFMTEILDIDFTPHMYFQSAKDLFYWKPRIINAIMADYKISDIVRELHVTTYFRELCRIWKKEYDEFNQNNDNLYKYLKRFYLFYPFMDKELLINLIAENKSSTEIDEEYKRKWGAYGYTDLEYHKFLRRCIFVYNKINNDYLNQLFIKSTSARDIDIAFLKILLRNTSTMLEIAEKLQIGIVQARKFLRNILGINYKEAVREFVWKPELFSYIEKYDSISDIAHNEDYNLSTLRHRFRVIWADELKKLGSLKKVYRHLKEKYK